MKRIVLIIILISILFGQRNGYGDAFLNIGASSRTIALGQAVVALPNNVGGYLVNPAATGYIPRSVVSGMYINQFELAEYISLGYTTPTRKGFQWGVYGVNLIVDNIFKRPEIEQITDIEARRDSIRSLVANGFDSFDTRESGFTFNISKNINYNFDPGWRFATLPLQIPVGLNIKVIQKQLLDLKGTGIGADIGGIAKFDLEQIFLYDWLDDLALGLSINNILGTRILWSSEITDIIPMQIIFGGGYFQTFDNLPVKASVFWQKNSIYSKENQWGAEITIFDIVNIRGGSNYGYLQGGLGLLFSTVSYAVALDYSFSNHDLGNAHRIGGWISF